MARSTGDSAEVEVGLRREKDTLATVSVPLQAGISTIPLPIDDDSRGECTVYANVAGRERTLAETVRIVSSPWEVKQP